MTVMLFDTHSIEMVECSTSFVKFLTRLTNRVKCQKIVNTNQKTRRNNGIVAQQDRV